MNRTVSTDAPLRILERLHGARLLIVGDVMLDRFVHGSIERLSPEAPIPVLSVERTLDMPGGAANVARNAAALGAAATLIGIVGADEPAGQLRAQLRLLPSIDARLIEDSSRPTTLKTRFVSSRQQLLRADREVREPPPAPLAQMLQSIFLESLPAADLVVLSDYAKGVLGEDSTPALIDAARRAGKPVLVDPKGTSFARYAGARVLTPNRAELEAACGRRCASDQEVAEAAASVLRDVAIDALIVTRGAQGMTVATRDAPSVHLAAQAREVFDVSGAGDTAVATLALALACGASLDIAARIANAAAGLVVAKSGTAVVSAGEVIAAAAGAAGIEARDKLFTLSHVATLVHEWRAQGQRIAFTNGCFDLLHAGHLAVLEQARASADRLIVGLNSDLSVRRLKGADRPVQGEVTRAMLLAALKSVDAVVIFPEDTPLELIGQLQPDVLVKGADYTIETVVGAELVQARGGRVLLIERVPDQSTSGTVARLRGVAAP